MIPRPLHVICRVLRPRRTASAGPRRARETRKDAPHRIWQTTLPGREFDGLQKWSVDWVYRIIQAWGRPRLVCCLERPTEKKGVWGGVRVVTSELAEP